MRGRLLLLGAVSVGSASLLCACSDSGPTRISSAVTSHFKGLPQGVSVAGDRRFGRSQNPWVARAGSGSIDVMTWGSGSCPNIPSSVKASGTHRVVIKTVVHDFYEGDNACTSDLAVTTSVVRLPASLDSTGSLIVEVDRTTTHLAARAR